MADDIFENPRLAILYDAFDDDRGDLVTYLGMASELGASTVLDLGCGTGTLALLLAAHGRTVTGIDPARASLDVARVKPGADRVTWIHGDARRLPATQVDLVTMTGNVAQAIADPSDWDVALRGARDALRRGGHLVFETRDPAARAWTGWNRDATRRTVRLDGIGAVEHWVDLTGVSWPLVTFRCTWRFHAAGAVLTSDSTLRFRERPEIEADLARHGFTVVDVRGAPDRPGKEFVFLAAV